MAASRSLGTLTLDLVAKIGGFISGMSRAEREADRRLRNISNSAKKFAKQLGTTLGIGISAGITATVAGITQAIDRMDELRDMSIRLGIGVETLSAFSYAAKQLGTDIDTLGKGFKLLAKNIADSTEGKGKASVFEALGFSTQDLKDAQSNGKAFEKFIIDLAGKISQLEDGAQKAALMLELFGKAGLDLTEFFNQGSDGIQKLIDRARELGVVFDQDAADQADEFNDTIEEIKASAIGLATSVAIELLPILQDLATTLKGYAKDANQAAEISDFLKGLWKTLAGMGHAVSSVFEILGAALANVAATGKGAYDILAGIVSLDFSKIADGARLIKAAASGLADEVKEGFTYGGSDASGQTADFSKVAGSFRSQLFAGVKGSFTSEETQAIQAMKDRLAKALGGGGSPGKTKKGGGKSDTEREAEQIAKAIREMTKAQKEWESELNETGNAIADSYAKRLAEINERAEEFAREGVPTEKVAEFRVEMERLAAAIKDKDTLEYLEEFRLQTEDMVLSATGANTATVEYTRAIAALNEELARGIITQEDYNERAEALALVRDQGAMQVLRDIEAQREQLGLTAEAQDTYNKLAYAGVDANSELGQAIIAANAELYRQAEAVQDQVDMMDSFRDSVKGFFQDVRDGTNVWDALKSAVDRFADALFNIILNNLVEKALGQTGSASGGASGGWLESLAGLLFSSGASGTNTSVGPRAIGGQVSSGMLYQINEHRPEVLSMGGRDYLMMGGQNGQVHANPIPSPVMGGDVNIKFELGAPTDPRTQSQIAAKVGFETQRAMKRNGR